MNTPRLHELPDPMGLLAELTHRCPLSCPYCSNPLELIRAREELTRADWLRVFDEAAKLGVLHVHLSGGEPLVRKDLESLVAGARKSGLYTNLITSGVLLDEARLDALKAAGLAHVQLSIQAATRALADKIGGFEGGFEKKQRAARWVSERAMALTINFVVHRHNIDDVGPMIDWAKEVGASRVEVAHSQYLGWALENRAALLPTREQVDEVTRIVKEARKRTEGELMIDYVPPDYYGIVPKPCMGGWGRRFINVAPNGDVLPCHGASNLPDMTFDNVRDRSLEAIWTSSEAFERFRGESWMKEPCASCPKRGEDFGGCRCQAFALTGDPTQADPVCHLSPFHDELKNIVAKENSGDALFIYRSYQRP